MPGQVLGERYEVEQQLGKKAGRWTLLARDLITDEPVILKLLFIDDSLHPTDLRLFQREVEALRLLNHPATPRYRGYFEIEFPLDGKALALIQSYVSGISLADILTQGQVLSPKQVSAIARSVLTTLDYLHNHTPPIVHRDIRPNNVLLGAENAANIEADPPVYLVDFGSVKALTTTSTALTVVGSDGYVPPEQFGGRALAVSDLYSLGATLINGLTGLHPATLQQGGPRIQFESHVSASDEFLQWLQRLTSPNLDKRWSSAAAALAALDELKEAQDNGA